ncbi:hypothetical protein M758_12G104900 [Ceratodon purpureus]|nr:hypothetical protein M758_12G104900 [Ceratodon purpureus]
MGNSTSQDAGKPSVVSVLGAKTVIPTVRVFCCFTPILTSEEGMVSCIPCVDQRITGRLCDGEGCKVVYHKECLNPPLQTVPAGEWYCPGCEKGKVGKIWSISDATGSGNLHGDQHNSEDEAQNDVPLGARFGSSSQHPEGAVNETGLVSGSCANVVNTNLKDGSVEYLVQWKSRSHAHDKWVNEKELEKLAPKELARFKKLLHEGQLYHAQEKYDAEWTEPERIIQKRLTRVTRRRPDSPVEKEKISNIQNAEIEWFVKWKGLGNEHCTWELANAGVLASSRGIELINESEGWKNAAMQRARKESQEERSGLNFRLRVVVFAEVALVGWFLGRV